MESFKVFWGRRMYQIIWNTYFLLSLMVFCSTSVLSLASESPFPKKPDYLINECSILQGNGADWAAIFAWLAEDLSIKAEKAENYERTNPGKLAGISFTCMVGGSSGSAASMVFMQLLKNRQLGLEFLGKHTLGVQDTKLVSKALRVIAYSVDLTAKEKFKFIKHALHMVLWVYPIDVMKALVVNEKFPNRWTFKLLDGNYIFYYFANTLLLARYITRDLINLPISKVLPSKYIPLAKKYGLHTLGNILKQHDDDISEKEESRISKIFEIHGKKIVKISRSFLKKNLKPKSKWKYLNREALHNGPLFTVLNEPLEDGFCSITMTELWSGPQLFEKQLSYDKMRPIVLCNKRTVETILSSKLYQHHLSQGYPYVSRFILGVVKTVRGAISPSIREPWLMASLSGPLDENELEIKEIYDPVIDLNLNSEHTFKTIAADGFYQQGERKQLNLGIIGGFADRRIAAWMLSYYFLEKLEHDDLRQENISHNISMFGLPDERKLDKFDTYLIKNDLAASGYLADEYLKDWSLFQFNWFETFKLPFHRKKIGISTVAFNFDLSVIPAAIDRRSRYLVPLAANITRAQLYAFDSSIDLNIRYFEPDIEIKFPNKRDGAYWIYEFGPDDPLDPNFLLRGKEPFHDLRPRNRFL